MLWGSKCCSETRNEMRRNALNALITSKCIGFLCSGEAMLLWGKYALRRRRKLSKKERIFPILGK
ncbi:MAG TPA: hypothetical protein P5543_11855, partial [Planctomycetota bacterium]|nr:hypothetical protein [Planctomycetota bacterium]